MGIFEFMDGGAVSQCVDPRGVEFKPPENVHREKKLLPGDWRISRIQTCDMNDLKLQDQFDRVVSVEMFEHMRNHRLLMKNIHGWLKPGGKLFVHLFCQNGPPYLYEDRGPPGLDDSPLLFRRHDAQ